MRVGVIFGGQSCEHDISVITGVSVVNSASIKHQVTPIYINDCGDWLVGNGFEHVKTFSEGNVKGKKVHLRPNSNILYTRSGKKYAILDVVIVCVHGANGEDGAIAGLLNLSGIAYTGSGILASAVGMDKPTQKRIYRDAGLKTTQFIELNRYEMGHKNSEGFFEGLDKINKLNFPLFVKPASLGSSIGIGKAKDFTQLFLRLDEGFEWDNRLIIEEAIEDFIEVNCAVLGYENDLIASTIEQPLTNEFLSYDDKYLTTPKKGNTGRYMPAHIDPAMSELVCQTAKQVFTLLGCCGVARIDFLIKDSDLYVNEINTIPGSLSSYLFAFDGLEFAQLIDKLIEIAQKVHSLRKKQKHTYNSNLLKTSIKK